MIVLSDIPFTLNAAPFFDEYKIQPGTVLGKKLESLIHEVRAWAHPKALYKISCIDKKDGDTVIVDGVVFASLALRKNLEPVERVFPYIATCGTEVDRIEIVQTDTLMNFWLYQLKGRLLEAAVTYLNRHIDKNYKTGNLSSMNPGSGDEAVWPIAQQRDLFSIFNGADSRIGVRLTDASVLIPETSLMGIIFPAKVDFQSCQLCHREKCRGRKAPFDKEVWKSVYESQ